MPTSTSTSLKFKRPSAPTRSDFRISIFSKGRPGAPAPAVFLMGTPGLYNLESLIPCRILPRRPPPPSDAEPLSRRRILGVDPAASGPTGYGVIETDGCNFRVLHYGALRIPSKRQKSS